MQIHQKKQMPLNEGNKEHHQFQDIMKNKHWLLYLTSGEGDHYSLFVGGLVRKSLASSLVCRNLWQTAFILDRRNFISSFGRAKCVSVWNALDLYIWRHVSLQFILNLALYPWKLHILFSVCLWGCLFPFQFWVWVVECVRKWACRGCVNDRAYSASFKITWFILVLLISKLISFMLLLIL